MLMLVLFIIYQENVIYQKKHNSKSNIGHLKWQKILCKVWKTLKKGRDP